MKQALALCIVLAAAACGPREPPDEPGPPAGGECASLSDCDAGLVCQGGMCLPYEGRAGDPCYDELDCEMGLDCKKGECVEAASDQ
ncbi:MAG: hypothetical protein JRG91_13100 [Deltaproteobacteria bacterium]|nr:hypothetical protein [Deltaproteobacteria bacterium]